MVVGKLLILLAINPVHAEIDNPRFFEYRNGGFVNRLTDISFGWFKTLDDEQKLAYNQSLTHALMYADNGEAVKWYRNDASGLAVPTVTWPNTSGYCRRLYVQAIAYGVERTMRVTACYDDTQSTWRWVNDKY